MEPAKASGYGRQDNTPYPRPHARQFHQPQALVGKRCISRVAVFRIGGRYLRAMVNKVNVLHLCHADFLWSYEAGENKVAHKEKPYVVSHRVVADNTSCFGGGTRVRTFSCPPPVLYRRKRILFYITLLQGVLKKNFPPSSAGCCMFRHSASLCYIGSQGNARPAPCCTYLRKWGGDYGGTPVQKSVAKTAIAPHAVRP